jgi:hypothetical protein
MSDMSGPPGWRLHTLIAPGLLPHTVQLCIHCRENPAGFWVSHKSAQAVRRPWCLSCCDVLDRGRYDVTWFGSQNPRPTAQFGEGP